MAIARNLAVVLILLALLLTVSAAQAIDLEKDLGLVPYGGNVAWANITTKLADANSAKLQAALDKAAASGTAATFTIEKCFPIGNAAIRVPGGVTLESGGLAYNRPQVLRGHKLLNGGCLMRIAPSAEPILRLNGHGNTIHNVMLCGAYWELETPRAFYNAGVQTDKLYRAGCGIEIVRDPNPAQNSGHHTISAGFAFCDVGIRCTFNGQEDHSDVCSFPRLDFEECPVGFLVKNKQSYSHQFGQFYYQAPWMSGSRPATALDLQRGGRFCIQQCTINGPCTVVQTNDVDCNTGGLTICRLDCDASCFGAVTPIRLLHMQQRRDFQLRVLSGQFSWSNNDLSKQWYNADGSGLLSGDTTAADVSLDIFGLSYQDRIKWGK